MSNVINVERAELGCYKGTMPGKRQEQKEKRSALVGVVTTPQVKNRIQEIADQHERTLSYTAEALLLRGLEAYDRDGKLKESLSGRKVS